MKIWLISLYSILKNLLYIFRNVSGCSQKFDFNPQYFNYSRIFVWMDMNTLFKLNEFSAASDALFSTKFLSCCNLFSQGTGHNSWNSSSKLKVKNITSPIVCDPLRGHIYCRLLSGSHTIRDDAVGTQIPSDLMFFLKPQAKNISIFNMKFHRKLSYFGHNTGGFPIEIKTKISYLIICCYLNFIR